jgi:hypothetical protein
MISWSLQFNPYTPREMHNHNKYLRKIPVLRPNHKVLLIGYHL